MYFAYEFFIFFLGFNVADIDKFYQQCDLDAFFFFFCYFYIFFFLNKKQKNNNNNNIMLHGFVVNFIVSLQLMTYLVLTILFDCTTCGLLFVFVIFESLSIIPYFLRRFLAFVACCSCFQQLIPYTCPLYCCFGFVLLSIYVCFSDKKSQLVI